MNSKLQSILRLWRQDRTDACLNAFYSDIQGYEHRKITAILKAVKQWFADEDDFVSFVTTMSGLNDGALDWFIEDNMGLVPIAEAPKPEVLEEVQESSLSKGDLFFNGNGILYARKSLRFDAATVSAVVDSLIENGGEHIALFPPKHLSDDEAKEFSQKVHEGLIEKGVSESNVHRVSEPFPTPNDFVNYLKIKGAIGKSDQTNVGKATKTKEGTPVKSQDPEKVDEKSRSKEVQSLLEIDPSTEQEALAKKVISVVEPMRGAKVSDLVRGLDDVGVSLSILDSGDGGSVGIRFFDRTEDKWVAGSKVSSNAKAFTFGGEYFEGRVDFNFELEDFLLSVIDHEVEEMLAYGEQVNVANLNDALKKKGHSFKLGKDLSTVSGLFFRKKDGGKLKLSRAVTIGKESEFVESAQNNASPTVPPMDAGAHGGFDDDMYAGTPQNDEASLQNQSFESDGSIPSNDAYTPYEMEGSYPEESGDEPPAYITDNAPPMYSEDDIPPMYLEDDAPPMYSEEDLPPAYTQDRMGDQEAAETTAANLEQRSDGMSMRELYEQSIEGDEPYGDEFIPESEGLEQGAKVEESEVNDREGSSMGKSISDAVKKPTSPKVEGYKPEKKDGVINAAMPKNLGF